MPSKNMTVNANNGVISVKLVNYLGNKTAIPVRTVGDYIVKEDNRNLAAGTNYTVKLESDSLRLYNGSTLVKNYGSTFTLEPAKYGTENVVYINSRPYIGEMTFTISGGYVRPINTLELQDYLKGVVPSEMSASKPLEALKAQAVAARTYATSYLGNSSIDDTQRFQVFGGYMYANESLYGKSNRAVDETPGEILTLNGRSIGSNALFYSTNGGKRLSNTNTWGTPLVSYFQTGDDPYDFNSGSPYVSWDYSLTKTQIDLVTKNLRNPAEWWNGVSEVDDSGIITKIKNWMYNKSHINQEYDMKITDVTNVNFGVKDGENVVVKPNFTSQDILYGEISFNYILKHKPTNTYRLDSEGEIEKHSFTIKDESYNIRSIVGTTTMYSPYIKGVVNGSNQFVVNGGGFGHGIGMSQYGAYEMADQGKTYKEILGFYYPTTAVTIDTSLIQTNARMDSVTYDKPSPQVRNTEINITAEGSGGTEQLYKFNMFDGEQWTVVQDYSPTNTFKWVPDKVGDYKFSVHIKDKFSSNEYDDYQAFEYKIVSHPIDIESVTTDKQSPQPVNSTVRLTANASGSNDILYKFHVYDGNEWTDLTQFTTSNTIDWKPTKGGDYKFSVHVKDKYSTAEYDDFYAFTYSIIGPPEMNSVTANKVSPQKVNETIRITANATGGTEKLYKFHVFDGNEWVDLTQFTASNTLDWTPTKAASYKFSVHVKDKNSSKAYDDFGVLYFDIKADPVQVQSVTANKTSPQKVNETIRITTNATGGSEKLYKFHVYDGKTWTDLTQFTTSNTFDWKPTKPASYKFSVHVKDKNSSKAYDDFGVLYFDINGDTPAPVQVQSLTPNVTSPVSEGTTVTFTANATGGVEKLYKFHVFDGKQWRVLKDYSTSNTLTWKPSAGEYKVVVHVRDRSSNKAYDAYTYVMYKVNNVAVKMIDVQKSLQSPQAVNTTVTLTALAEGGSQKLYKFHVYDGKVWTDLTQFTTSNTFDWKPTKAGTYKFSVHVKDKNSQNKYDDFKAFEYAVTALPPVDMVNVTHEKTADNKVKITANATGGSQLVYKFHVFDGTEWTVLQDYSSVNTFNWNPQPGHYKISVHVKDVNSSKTYDDYGAFEYEVK